MNQTTTTTENTTEKKKKGFACISPERRREIARMGGQRAHALGVAHRFTRGEAIVAGRKGGSVTKGQRVKPIV